MWAVVRGGVLMLLDQEKSYEIWIHTENIGQVPDEGNSCCPEEQYHLEAMKFLGSVVQGNAGRWTILYIASENLILPCPECKVSPSLQTLPFSCTSWVSCLHILIFVPGAAQSYSGSGSGPCKSTHINKSILTMCCAFTISEWTQGLFQGPFSYHDDALSNILRKCT